MALNKVTSEDVSMFLTAVLVGLQKHGEHESVQPVLLSLAVRIYELAVSVVAAFSLFAICSTQYFDTRASSLQKSAIIFVIFADLFSSFMKFHPLFVINPTE